MPHLSFPHRSAACFLAVVLVAVLGSASASPITFRFDGVVSATFITRAPWGPVTVGTPAYLIYTFESSTPDALPADTAHGQYNGAITSFTLNIGSTTATAAGGRILVTDSTVPFPGNNDSYHVDQMFLPGNFEMHNFLDGAPGTTTPLTSDAMPTQIVLAQWSQPVGNLIDITNNVGIIIQWNTFQVIQPASACCNSATGTCGMAVSSADCQSIGGAAQAATSCTPNPCPVPFGACCHGSACTSTAQAGCPGGTWQGGGAACSPAPGVNRCCRADFNNSGSITVQDIFDFLAAWFAVCP